MAQSITRRTTRFIYVSDATAPSSARSSISTVDPRYGWRVIAANNRPLGRSSAVFDSYQDCRDAAATLHARIEDASSSILFNTSQGHWTWSVAIDGDAVAVCVHPYLRRIECLRALRQFVDALTAGVPSTDGVRHFGARALREYDRPALGRTPLGPR